MTVMLVAKSRGGKMKMAILVYFRLATMLLTIVPAEAQAQFTSGHYQNSAASTKTLDIAAVTFRSGEKLTFISPLPLSCTGNLTFRWDFYVDKSYTGQFLNSADNIQTGKDTCTSGGTTIIILPGPPIVMTNAFSENSSGQIVVVGQGQGPFLSGTYIRGKSLTRNYSAGMFFDLDWNTPFKYIVKKPGERTRLVVGPLPDLYRDLHK
jgi:hypothetical protein